MSEICLEHFLSNIHPFLEGDKFDVFLSELQQVPNYQSVFRALLEEDPAWLELAQTSANGVSFFYEQVPTTSRIPLPNKLELRHFELGKSPTIKVTRYICTSL